MKTDELLPPAQSRVRFDLSQRYRVPDGPGCYALASFDSRVLYVGQTKDLRQRLCAHRDDEEKRRPVQGLTAVWFCFAPRAEKEIGRVERGWMNQYEALHGELPPLNKIYSPVG